MLERIKLLLNKDDSADELLNTLISMCKEEAYIYCNLEEYDSKMGSECTLSQSASGASASYDSFYSDKVVRMLNKFRKVKMV